MNKQEKTEIKSAATKQAVAEKKSKDKNKKVSFPMYPWVIQQGNVEGVKGDQMIVYHWLFWRNSLAKLRGAVVYGKVNYRTLYAEMTTELGIGRPDKICKDLQTKGWLRKTHAKPFGGYKTVGFLCMKDRTAKVDAVVEQQELVQVEELPENTHAVESSAKGNADNGERYQFGLRYYLDAEGEMVHVPLTAPARPSATAVWSNDPEGWYEPDELPEREMEY